MNLLCRIFGHRLQARVETVGEVSAYIGEVCPRCGHTVPDRLTRATRSLDGAYAVVHRDGGAPITISLLEIQYDITRFDGMLVTLKGRQA